MDMATHPLNRRRDFWAWRLAATGASFVLFGLGGLLLRVLVLPLTACLPGDAATRRHRARAIIGGALRLHGWFMWRTRVLDFSIEGEEIEMDRRILQEDFSEGRTIAALFIAREWLRQHAHE